MIWKDYDVSFTSNGSNLGSENLDSWVYNLEPNGNLSGVSKEFTLNKRGIINFKVECYGYEGCPRIHSLYIVKDGQIIKEKEYSFDDKGSRTYLDIVEPLEAGNYEIVIGSKVSYEFGIENDELNLIYYNQPTHSRSMWCWRESVLDDTDNLINVCNKLEVDAVYQEVVTTELYESNKLKNHISSLKNNGIQFYFCFGQANWYNDLNTIKSKIDIVYNYNSSVSEQYKSSGIIFDVEPHAVTDDNLTIDERLTIWYEIAKESYLYANSLGVRLIYCNPVWYKDIYLNSFTLYSDGLSYMNYDKDNMINNISEEMQKSQLYDKWIENITEFQQSVYVGEENSCYDLGIGGVHKIWEQISDVYPDNNISFSYHYYLPILDLIDDYQKEKKAFLDEKGLKEYTKLIKRDFGGNSGNYSSLINKPKINDIELFGNKSLDDLDIQQKIDDLETIRAGANLGVTSVQLEEGKGLSTNDFTTQEKMKLSGLVNYDDTTISLRVSTIEGKEAGWDAKLDVADLPNPAVLNFDNGVVSVAEGVTSELEKYVFGEEKPVKNLVDKDNPNIFIGNISSNGITVNSNRKSLILEIDAINNRQLTVNTGENKGNQGYHGAFLRRLPEVGDELLDYRAISTGSIQRTWDIPTDAKYFMYYYYDSTRDTLTSEEILSTLMIQYGETFTGYEPYKVERVNYAIRSGDFPFNVKDVCKSANKPMITITVDPGRGYNEMKSFKNVCDELGVKITIGLLSSLMNDSTGSETVKDLYLQWQSEGHHITTESYSHDSSWSTNTPDYAGIESNIVKGLSDMGRAGFVDYDYLICPNGNTLPKTQEIAQKWLKSAIRTTGPIPYNVGYASGRFDVYRTFIKKDSNGGKGFEGYKNDIDNCILNNGWLVFGIHTLESNNEYDEQLIRQIIQYAQSQNVPIYTYNQAFKLRYPIYALQEIFS